MKKISALVLFASMMVAGCGKMERQMAGGFSSAIRPAVSAMPLSKGVTVTTDNIGTFKMMAVTGPYIDHTVSETEQQPGGVYFNSFVKKDGSGNWDFFDAADATTPTVHYWINKNDIVFWSWYPLGLNSAATGILAVDDTPVVPPTTGYNTLGFTYTLPTHVDGSDAANQKDIVFAGNVESRTFKDGTDNITAAVSNGTTHEKDEYFSIVFHHALSKIQFGVNLNDNSFDKSLKIKKIELANLRSTGSCTFTAPKGFVWNDPATDDKKIWSQSFGTGVDFSGYTGASTDVLPADWPLNSSNSLYICTNAFFLIPQKLAANAVQMTVTFDLRGTEISKTANLPAIEWKGDCYYTYKIAAHGGSASLSMSISLADWSERENYIPID